MSSWKRIARVGPRTRHAIEVNVTSGECVTQTFENIQDDSGFCIEGYKLDANGLYGIPNWEIEAKPLAK